MPAKNNDHYAIVVGINAYVQLRRLQAAHQDATKFAAWLKSPDGGGLPPGNVKLILSPEECPSIPIQPKPVQEDIDEELINMGVLKGQRIGKRLYFYFAGHGIGPSFDEVGMLMAHASTKILKRNIGLQAYHDYFREHYLFDEVIFILDCCRDPARGIATAGPGFTLPPTNPIPQVQDFVVLAASYGEKAFEPSNKATGERRGLLTEAMLEAFKSPEAANSKGDITAYTLREFLRKRVIELAKEEKLKQKPEIPRLPNDDIIFCSVPNLKKVTVQIIISKNLGGEVILRDSPTTEIARLPANANHPEWVVDLDPNKWYTLEHSLADMSKIPEVFIKTRELKKDLNIINFPK